MIAPAFIQDKIDIRVSALLRVNRIGKRIPVEGLPFSEAGFEEVFSLLCPLPHCAAPDFGKQVLSPLLFLCDGRRLGQSVPAEHAEGREHRLIRRVFRCPEDCQRCVFFQHGRLREAANHLRRQPMKHRVLQHPSPKILSHGWIADAAVEKAFLKRPHFPQAVLRRTASDAAEQLIQVEIGQGSRNRAVLSLPDAGAPGEITPQLPHVKIMVGREIPSDLTRPGSVVLIVLHKPALTKEVSALAQIGAVAVFIQLHHLPDAARDLWHRGVRILPGKGQGGFPVDLFTVKLLWFQHNGYSLRLHAAPSFLSCFRLANLFLEYPCTKCRAVSLTGQSMPLSSITYPFLKSSTQNLHTWYVLRYRHGTQDLRLNRRSWLFISSASSSRKRTSRSQSRPARSRPRFRESG